MKRIHENLPNEPFSTPAGIVRASVCSRSGLRPIPGVCDVRGTVYTEYFADGTVPTESCNVHYEGYICAYDLMPVSPNCPFPVYGTAEVPLIEDPALQRGSSVVGADGQVQQAATSNHCMHDDAFFANPDYEAALNIQRLEIEQRNAAAGILPEGEGAVTPGTDPGTQPPGGDPAAGGQQQPAGDPAAGAQQPAGDPAAGAQQPAGDPAAGAQPPG